MNEDIPFAYRFVAKADTQKRMARGSRVALRRRRWVVCACSMVLFGTIINGGMKGSWSLGARIFWSGVYALVPTLLIMILVTVTINVYSRRPNPRIFDGAVLESGFGEDEMVVRNPIASTRLAYAGIKSVTVRGNFVYMRYHGSQVVAGYPRELFPDEAIDRILHAIR